MMHGDEEDDDDDTSGDARDDERTGTRYNVSFSTCPTLPYASDSRYVQYSWFHVIFVLGAMYVAMLLTDWNYVKPGQEDDVHIGRSEAAMWIRIVSSWVCMLLYMWSLLAPALFPDRYVLYPHICPA